MKNTMNYDSYQKLMNKNYRVAIYCRLSKDDDLKGESASIANQKALLEQYCEKQGWEIAGIYQDDGFTGLNQERPDFQKMLAAIEHGIVNLVITKDLSRLGRNYLETGHMIEDYFPRHGVRYIALNDGIDTERDNNDIAPFKNILNEMYSKDISKKVHASYYLKATKGKFTGCIAPFGYMKDPTDKNHLLIDDETAPYVRMIFELAEQGRGVNYIAHRLEENKVPCPTWWNRNRGFRNIYTKWEKTDPECGKYVWDFSVLKDMLRNPVYYGAIASQRFNYKFKIGTMSEKSPDEWILVENCHEPIVSKEVFDAVQKQVSKRKMQRLQGDGNYSIFAGLIKCGECGKTLTVRYTNAKNPIKIYACKTYNAHGKHRCTQHRIEYDALYKQVLKEIRSCARKALKNEDEIIERITSSKAKEYATKKKVTQEILTKHEERIKELDKLIIQLYADRVAGKLSEDNFNSILSNAQKEQEELKTRIRSSQKTTEIEEEKIKNAKQWAETIKQYADIKELDSATLHKLIDRIIVHEKIDDEGVRNITTEIHFNICMAAPKLEQPA